MGRKLKSALQRVQAEASAARVKAQKEKSLEQIALNAKAKKQAQNQSHPRRPPWVPFDNDHAETVLLVGEGDFSFAAALAERFDALDVVATSLDTEKEIGEKYADTAPECVQRLKYSGGEVIHGIDTTQLTKHRPIKSLSTHGKPVKVVFNFPHLGNSVADQDRNIRQHQELLLAFFKESKAIGASQVAVSLFKGEPYESWQPKQLARSAGWKLDRSGSFPWDEFPGYSHQLTSKGGARTNRAQKQREARMFLWKLA